MTTVSDTLSGSVMNFVVRKLITHFTTKYYIKLHRVPFPTATKTLLVQITLRVWTTARKLPKY
jgi:hypothetical protein